MNTNTKNKVDQIMKFHIFSKYFMIKISEIFAHARTKSFSVHGPDVLIERVIVDQFEVEATVTPPSSTLRKLEPEQNRHLSKKKYF